MIEPVLLRDDVDGVARLTLNRPRRRNALSTELMAAMQREIDAIGADRSVHVVVVAGAGPAFCAGHDLEEIRAASGRGAYESLFERCSRLMTAIAALPKPAIAQVHGAATAAGCQLAASCDLAVASADARFATPGVDIGLFCSTPMVALSRNVARKHAMEMLLTGDAVSAEDARAMGLVNRVVAPGALERETMALARRIASKSPLTLAIGKEAFYRQIEMPLDDAYAYASRTMAENMMARDAGEGIDAFLEKRPARWTGD